MLISSYSTDRSLISRSIARWITRACSESPADFAFRHARNSGCNQFFVPPDHDLVNQRVHAKDHDVVARGVIEFAVLLKSEFALNTQPMPIEASQPNQEQWH